LGDRGLKAVTGKEFCRALERNSWQLLRIRGSHHVYDSPDGKRRVSVPVHAGETLKRGMLAALLTQTGLSGGDI